MNLLKEQKQFLKQRISILILSLLAILILNSIAPAQTITRVSFLTGKANVTMSDSAKIGESDTYVIKLKKGQRYQIDVQWRGKDINDEGQGLSGYSIIYPNGEKMTDPQDSYLLADLTGDYRIIVSPRSKKTNYRYRIIFTQF